MPPPLYPARTASSSEHRHRISCCIGIVCFEEVAHTFGTRSSNKLEILIDDYVPLIDADGKEMWSGKYRKWPMGRGKGASIGTIKKVAEKSGGKSELTRWRNLILWYLLEEPFTWIPHTLRHLITYLSGPANGIVRKAILPDSRDRYLSTDSVLELTRELRDLNTLDGFLGLLLLAREAKLIKNDQRHVLATIYAFEVFPRIVLAHVHLHACWKLLYRCVEFAFLSRVPRDDNTVTFSIDIVRRQMAVLRENSR